MKLQSALKLSMKWTYSLIHTHTYCTYIHTIAVIIKMIKIKYTFYKVLTQAFTSLDDWYHEVHSEMTDFGMHINTNAPYLKSKKKKKSWLDQEFLIKHFSNTLDIGPIHICASHLPYGFRTHISSILKPPPQHVFICQLECFLISLSQSQISSKYIYHFTRSEQECIFFPFNKNKLVNSLCQYCRLTLRKRRWTHNRRWSLSTDHFLQIQTSSCNRYEGESWREGERERERERENETDG